MQNRIAIAAALLLLAAAPARADYVVKDGNGVLQTIKAGTISGAILPFMSPVDATGAAFGTATNPFAIQFGTGVTLPAFAATPAFKMQDGVGNALNSTGGALNVAIISGGGNGGTASSFAAAFPALGTAIGVKNGANMVNLTADGSSNLNVNCAVGCAGGTFNNNADAVTTSASNGQAAAWLYGFNGATWDRLREDTTNGLWVNVKSSVLPTGAATAAGVAAINTTLGSPMQAGGSIGNTSFGISGTVPSPTTASAWGLLAQGSATSGALGQLALGAVTTAAPAYSSGFTSPLSLDTAGNLRVNVVAGGAGGGAITAAINSYAAGALSAGAFAIGAGVDGWDLTQGQINDAAVAAGAAGSISAKLRAISRDVGSPLPPQPASVIVGGVGVPSWAGGTLGAMANYGTSPGAVLVPGVNAFVTNNPSVTPSAQEVHLGEMGSNQIKVQVAQTVTASAYATGNSLGALMTVAGAARVSGALGASGTGGILTGLMLNVKSVQSVQVDVFLFDANPSGSTCTDKTAFVLATADFDKVVGMLTIPATAANGAGWFSGGTGSVGVATYYPLAYDLSSATSLFACAVVRGAFTPAATTDVSFKFNLLRN